MQEEEEILNMYGKGAFDGNFHLKHNRKIYIDKYIEPKTIKPLLQYGELNLLVAPTGAGKTYSVMEIIKELSKENPTTCYIVTCPNRIQNIQNKKYDVAVCVGGIEQEYNLKTVSMVYDKAEEIIKQCEREGRKVILIVDEAHQLIEAYNYRCKAVKGLLNIIKNHKVKRTLFITATPKKIDKNLGIFNYNYNYYICYKKKNKAKNVKNLNILISQNKENALINIINQNKEKGIISVIELNNIKEHDFFQLILTKRNFKVESLHSKNKNYIYDSIIEKDLIPPGIDVILTTSMLECGTNIKNTNVSFIAIPNRPSYLDLDCLEQFYARARLYNETFYLILENKNIEEEFKNFEEIVNIFAKEIKERTKDLNNALKGAINVVPDENLKQEIKNIFVQGILKNVESNDKTITRGCIVFDENKQRFIIDEYLFTKQSFKMYYQQFYFHINKLKKELKERIKCDRVIIKCEKETLSDEIKQDIKQLRIDNKEIEEKQKEEIKKYLKEILNNDNEEIKQEFLEEFQEFINDNKYLAFAKYKEKLEKIILEKNSLEFIKKILDTGQDIETSVKIVANRKNDKEINEKICEIGYIKLNNIYNKIEELSKDKKEIKIPKTKQVEYFKIRHNLDNIMNSKSKRLTNERIILLAKELNLLKSKDIKLWNEKKELSKATGRKLMKVINFIYNLSENKDGYRITSLKKEVKN